MTPFSDYLRQIKANLASGDATEHTHRTALKLLIESLATGITATNEPKRADCGAPDYIVSKGRVPVGYIEAKDVGKSLDDPAYKEQFTRYRESLGNLIITDYLEFRWYEGGEHRLTARLANLGSDLKVRESKDSAQSVEQLLRLFLETQTPVIGRPKELAERMARLARLIRESTAKALDIEEEGGSLHGQMEGFRRTLLRELSEADFADMYAQTICYGLFAAWCNADKPVEFSREHAAYDLPKTNPFLRRTWQYIAGYDLNPLIAWAVDDVANILARGDREAILRDFDTRTGRQDPVVHFYETFLAAYDPALRERRGVYYTPEPVVSYIVRSVDWILKSDFGLADGLADSRKITRGDKQVHQVQILDPATGTGTFLHDVIDHIHKSFSGNQGMWSSYVREHLLPRVFGFELLMAPYAVAHMKLAYLLKETGYDFSGDERLNVFLTNALDEGRTSGEAPGFGEWIAKEGNAAKDVKRDVPIMVVLGNPPYSVSSQNKGQWITGLIEDYKSGLREKKLNLDDDFIKFIRFAQWRIEQTGYGVLAFITSHTYLDGITHRQMRKSLMGTFDDIYIVDLHGNAMRKERCTDGSRDENVFDIQQGVAISIFVRRLQRAEDCSVHFAEMLGARESKYERLSADSIDTTEWDDISPSASQSDMHFFIPKAFNHADEYRSGWSLQELFLVQQSGVKTDRDDLFFDLDEDELRTRIGEFYSDLGTQSPFRERYRVEDSSSYPLLSRRRATQFDGGSIHQCLYRPFDPHYLYYTPDLTSRPAYDIMRHVLAGSNVSLVFMRQVAVNQPYSHFLATTHMVDNRAFYSNKGIMSAAPLYLYPTAGEPSFQRGAAINLVCASIREAARYEHTDGQAIQERAKALITELFPSELPRWPNLAPEFIADFSAKLAMKFVPDGKGDRHTTFGAEDVFSYMYAVFHSPTYRTRYTEFLKIDFPRLPLTSDADLFRALCAIGDDLVALHLMNKQGSHLPSFPIEGSGVVEAVRYTEPTPGGAPGRVWINATQYFEDVKSEVWEFHIGGYQVCQKWLKDRKGRTLTYDDQKHYQGIVAALGDTITLMSRTDESIAAHGGFPIT